MSTIREILLGLPILDIDHILDHYLLPYISTNIDLALTDFISNIKVIESPSNAQLILLEKNKLTKLTTPMCLEEIINVLRYEYDTLAVETIPQLNRIQECFRGIHVEKLSPEILNTLSSDYRAWYAKYGSTFRDWYTKYGDISLTFRGAKPRLFTATTSLPHLNIIDTKKRNDRTLKLSITSMNSRKRKLQGHLCIAEWKLLADGNYIGDQTAIAQFMIGLCYYKGSGIEMNLATAVKYWKKSSFGVNECASYRLGKCYYYGLGVKVNYHLAFDHFLNAAFKGHYGAFTSLDEFFSTTSVIDLDLVEEMLKDAGCRPEEQFDFLLSDVEWTFEMAAVKNRIRHLDTGCGGRLYLLGLCFYGGIYAPQSYAFAVRFWKRGDESGDSFCTYKLGKCYFEGIGVEKNLTIAFELWSKISEVNPLARVSLGVYFYKEKNIPKAIEYWKETASCGFSKAINNLAQLKQEIPQCSTDYLAFNTVDNIYSQYLCDVGGYNINDQEACYLAHTCLKKTPPPPPFRYCFCLAYECDCYVQNNDLLFDESKPEVDMFQKEGRGLSLEQRLALIEESYAKYPYDMFK